MKKLILITLLFYSAFSVKAQNLILNGSFEQNNYNQCDGNWITSPLSSITSYGGGYISLVKDSCQYCNPQEYWGGGSQDGNWFMLMNGNNQTYPLTKIAFDLDSPLSNQISYNLSFYIKMPSDPAACQDTLKNNYIKVGISNNPNQFGTHLYTSPLGTDSWQEYSIIFIPQNNEEYITVEAGVNDTNHYVIFVDNFFLEETTASATVDLSGKNKQLLKIVDVLGQEVPYKKNVPLFYMYSDGTVEKKLIVQ